MGDAHPLSTDSLSWESVSADVAKIPEFYLSDAGSYHNRYVELLHRVHEADPGAARWMVDMGLFLEDKVLSADEVSFVERAISRSPDILRLFVSHEVLDGIDGSEALLTLKLDLESDLNALPEVGDGLTRLEEEALLAIQGMIDISSDLSPFAYEVRKGLCLMDEYGTTQYLAPSASTQNPNRQLQVLFWLLSQADIPEPYWVTALACGLAYGTVVTIGDPQVDLAIRYYVPELLSHVISTDTFLAARGTSWSAKDYPLEAAIVLVWGASGTLYPPFVGASGPLYWSYFIQEQSRLMSKEEFEWCFVSPATLREMRGYMEASGHLSGKPNDPCIDSDFEGSSSRFPGSYNDAIDRILAALEDCFVHSGPTGELPTVGPNSHLNYISQRNRVVLQVNGKSVYSHGISNPDWQWRIFHEEGNIVGISDDYAAFQGMLAKSVNIAAGLGDMTVSTHGHRFILYYNPADAVFRTDTYQAEGNGFAVGNPPAEFGFVSIPWDNLSFDHSLSLRCFYNYTKASKHLVYATGIPPGFIYRVVRQVVRR